MEETKSKRKMQFCTIALVLLLTSFLLFRSKEISAGIAAAVDLCLYSVLPSLFGMMVVSNLIVSSKIFEKALSPFSFVTRYLFKLPAHLTSVVLIGFIGGYPVGAKLIDGLYRDGEIDRKTAERMLTFCVNAGPAFVISAVSIPIFHNARVGFLVLAAHLISNLTVAFLGGLHVKIPERAKNHRVRKEEPPLSVRLVLSVNNATRSMLIVCSFIVAFSILLTIIELTGIQDFISGGLGGWIGAENAEALMAGILEVTQGCSKIPGNSPLSVYLLTAVTSFGGICVHMQLTALLSGSGLKLKKYFLSRFLHLPLSLLLVWLMSFWWAPSLEAFAPQEPVVFSPNSASPYASFFLVLLCIILLFATGKSDTIKKRSKKDEPSKR